MGRLLASSLTLLLSFTPWIARAEAVRLPGPDGIMLNAELFLPNGTPHGAPVLELHSCAGPNARRDAEWARVRAAWARNAAIRRVA